MNLLRIMWNQEEWNLSSPFDKSAVDFLEKLNVSAYKIASFEITDTPLIEYVASKQKPIIISTGIAHKEDIQLAIDTCREVGNNQVILLKCTSEYPTPLGGCKFEYASSAFCGFRLYGRCVRSYTR